MKKADILLGMQNEDELREYVIGRLVNHTRLSDITQEVCVRSGLYWSEAEAFVREVAVTYESDIRKKRSPALVALAAVTFLGGTALIVVMVYMISNVIIFYRSTQPELLSTLNILLLILNEAQVALWIGSFGLAMVAGSLIGMRDVWLDWLG